MYQYICHKCVLIFCSEKEKENKCPNCTSVRKYHDFQNKRKNDFFSFFNFINFKKKYL